MPTYRLDPVIGQVEENFATHQFVKTSWSVVGLYRSPSTKSPFIIVLVRPPNPPPLAPKRLHLCFFGFCLFLWSCLILLVFCGYFLFPDDWSVNCIVFTRVFYWTRAMIAPFWMSFDCTVTVWIVSWFSYSSTLDTTSFLAGLSCGRHPFQQVSEVMLISRLGYPPPPSAREHHLLCNNKQARLPSPLRGNTTLH